jgi:transposase-like protein
MNTPNPEFHTPAATRRRVRYSDEFKRQVVAACHAPGISKAAIALANGLNANMLRRWVVESSQDGNSNLTTITKPLPPTQAQPDFIPVKCAPLPSAQSADIRIELQHARGAMQIHWPMAASSQCAQWVREVLA